MKNWRMCTALLAAMLSFSGCGNAITQTFPADENGEILAENNVGTVTTVLTEAPTEVTTTTVTTTEPPVSLPVISGATIWANSIAISGSGTSDFRAISPYYGTHEYGEQYASTINQFRDAFSSDINIYNMCLPTSAGFYIPDDCKDVFSDEGDNIEHINSCLTDGVVGVDAWTNIGRHTAEEIYSRTDHHWAPLGAYYGAEAFADAAGLEYLPLTAYQQKTKDNFVGSMYYFSGYYEEINQHPEIFTYYVPNNTNYTTTYYDTTFSNPTSGDLIQDSAFSKGNSYMIFQGGDEKITEIQTDAKNDKVLVIVKDSYGNAISPYLLNDFSKIYVIDFRYFDTDFTTFISRVRCTDLLFAISLTACQTPSHIESIRNLIG